jgi:hypothetical protein
MVNFGNWMNRINSSTSSMFLSLGDFHQDDFSCMVKLQPTEKTTIIITNEYRGFIQRISIIEQKKLIASLKKQVGIERVYIWDKSKKG